MKVLSFPPCSYQLNSQYLRYESTDNWTKKYTLHIYTLEYYSSTTKNEILSFAAKWLQLGTIMLLWMNLCFQNDHNTQGVKQASLQKTNIAYP